MSLTLSRQTRPWPCQPVTRNGRLALLGLLALIGLILCVATPAAHAQTTTASLRGTIVDNRGNPVADAQVTLRNVPTNQSREATTNSAGQFAFGNLKVGGPYTLTGHKTGMVAATSQGIFLKAGSNPATYLQLASAEKIAIVGQRLNRKTGLYDSRDIDNAPSIGRDIKDVVRLNPEAVLDGNSLSVGGQNNRFNSITIDGIRQDDDFGLNSSGYPTRRSPISMEAIEEVSLTSSPFDVRYGSFLGGNINVVTKSGTNEFSGVGFMTYRDSGLTGKKSKDLKVENDFKEARLGATAGGALIKDELFYFLSVEGLQSTQPNIYGPEGSGVANATAKVSAADAARAQDIAQSVYGFDAGATGQDLDEDDRKFLAKFDWHLSDQHHLETKYQHTKGNTISPQSSSRRLALTSNWYNNTETLETVSLRLMSDWDYATSTKIEVSGKKAANRQKPLNGNDFMQATITSNDGGSIRLGPDEYRHANEMTNYTFHTGGEINHLSGSHLFTGGLLHDRTKIDNLFVPGSNGVASYRSLDDFANRKPGSLRYQNAISNDPQDGAAAWGFDVYTLFAQDEFQMTPALQTTYGLRLEVYEAEGKINRNENFVSRHGFSNTADISGKQALLPRLGVTYQATNRLNLKGGAGLYSGGTPNVWISNNYSNDGVNLDTASTRSAEGFDGRQIPQDLRDSLTAGDGNVNALDPDFKIPQSWKFNTGMSYRFAFIDDLNFDFNYTYTKVRYGVMWKDLRRNHTGLAGASGNNTPTAVGPDGRDLYDTNGSDDSPDDFDPSRGYDLLLTNTDKGFGHNAQFSLSKSWTSGFHVTGSYAWQKVMDVNPGTSSTATSNYSKLAIGKDPNDPELATSNYQRTHRFLLATSYENTLFGNLLSSVSLFFERRSGQPYSFTFGGDRDKYDNRLAGLFGESEQFADEDRMLFYVPKGDGSDVVLDGIDEGAFNNYLRKYGLDKHRGEISPRNGFEGSWVDRVDLRLAQDLPAPDAHRAKLTFDIINLPNLLNKRWGQVKQPGFPYMHKIVDVDYDPEQGKYVYSNFNGDNPESVRLDQSIWQAQMALHYYF